MRVTGAIFDMDGVLFDTEQIYQQTWHEIAAERRIDLGSGFLKAVSGTSGERMRQVIEKYYHVSDGRIIVEDCMDRVRDKLSVYVPVKKGVYEILEFFKQKEIPMAVASSSSNKQIEANLEKAEILSYFSEIVSGAEVKQGKPAPDIFQRAAMGIGCEPENCFVFEDSENGVMAGFAAGCATIMVPDLIEPSAEMEQYCLLICQNLLEAQEKIADIIE